ncbi:LysM peptidoglycan-binding domain-containing protein [Streptococcus thoraltensis]|uniref:aggregation-promoting factor n=1 Tax=Streptococcus thoraltensis TaxID=55085 RepID=UPI0003709B54|nr:LysM peptidoglycan-binding domain-containing protein [Streptococcus thoraltensis]MDY4760740.1 LysM peptidoglycan-binding domain-containing protein [Streptococcus thoraltensis]
MLNQKKIIKLSLLGLSTLATLSVSQLVKAESYTVKSGDTLSAIAKSHQMTVNTLAQVNRISDINSIEVGEVLELSQTKLEIIETSLSTNSIFLNQEEQAAKDEIARRESSGSYAAQNGQYYGRYQLTLSYLKGDLSPENQERVADNYVKERYGSWTAALAFWNTNGWY